MDCRIKNPRSKKKCNPECAEHTVEIRTVMFKNGTLHLQQICRICRSSKYIPRDSNTKQLQGPVFESQSKIRANLYDKSFYTTPKWLELRYRVFVRDGKKCAVCNISSDILHVDHIKPRSKYPELELDINNLQILCKSCNLGKGNWDETKWNN